MLAKLFDAHINCLHVSPRTVIHGETCPMMPAVIYSELKEAIKNETTARAQKAKQLFENIAKKHDVPIILMAQAKDKKMSASWQDESKKAAETSVAQYGKLTDLIVVRPAIKEMNDSYESVITAALFETGRPVMLLPIEPPPKAIGENIIIAWDASAQAVHSTAMAYPFLKRAKTVSIITVNEDKNLHSSAKDLKTYLELHNIAANSFSLEKGDQSIGSTIIEESVERQADLIVMGAFGHSRISEMLMGGATKTVLKNTKLPILMMH